MKKFIYATTSFNFIEKNDVGIIEDDFASKKFKVKFLRFNQTINVVKDQIDFFDIEKIGDSFDHKVCDRCFKRLPTNDFSNNRIKKGGFITKRPSCKSCRKIKDGKPISQKDRKKWEKLKPKNYDLFKCPICNKSSIAGISKIVLDHNHQSGEVRGYLCESCNTGIGRFDDDPTIVIRAKEWLEKLKK